jgi:eukaryotic-like serine/threonine-protein kinase
MLTPGGMLGGRYKLDERIAGGGMGDVWKATDEVLGRVVAVKVLLAALLEEPGFAERFRAEARTMATINHAGVVDIYDYGNENGTAFLVMEYIEGDALSRTLARVTRLTPGRTMALIAQAADALHAAHEKGIVHRDVKPGNLLVRPNGTLVLTDFGIARSAAIGQLTQPGSVLGTASYISPEQAAGQGASPLSDVYALGVVAFQCLAGRRPFEGENPLEIAMKHVRDAPPPLPPDVPQPARQIVERAMAKEPSQRFSSAAEMAHVARQAAAQLSSAHTGYTPTGQTSAPPAGPVSGGPASQVSGVPAGPVSGVPGAPVSGAPHQVSGPPVSGPVSGPPKPEFEGGPAGTQVLPPGALPESAQAPVGQGNAGPGQFARGVAGAPPIASNNPDTGYTYVGTGPMQTANQPGFPSSHAPSGATNGRRPNVILIGGLVAAVLALLCIGGGAFWLNLSKDDKPGANPPASPTAAAKATGPAKEIDCKGMKGKNAPSVEKALKEQGFTVKVTKVDEPGEADTVVDVPCSAPEGSEVELKVRSGNGAGGRPTPSPCSTGVFGGIGGNRTCPPQ